MTRPSAKKRRSPKSRSKGSSGWGGRREGAGRPKSSDKVGHDTRPALRRSVPARVIMRADPQLRLRSRRLYLAFLKAIEEAQGRFSMRVLHWSVQHEHIHMIVEARDQRSLSKGMQGLSIRTSRAINRALGRPRGQVFVDRYDVVQLETPRQVRDALSYVLNNRRRQLAKLGKPQPGPTWVDPFCSGVREGSTFRPTGLPPAAEPRTWLARVGWKRYGLVKVNEVPE